MNDAELKEAFALAIGWKHEYIFGNGVDGYAWVHPNNGIAYSDDTDHLPDPLDLNNIQRAEIAAGIHDPKNHELRIKWVFCLRDAVKHRCPLNKLGQPLISTIDQLCATPKEKAIAFINTVKQTT